MEEAFSNKIIKLLLIVSFILTSASIICLINPVNSYELSIYSSIPLFWLLIIISTALTITNLVYQTYSRNYWGFWIAFFILILNNFLIAALPLFRGYYIYGSNDPWGHFKFTRMIIFSGHIGDNYYPIIHLLATEISKLANVSLELSVKLLPPIYTAIFMIFSYYLAKTISVDKRNTTIIAAVSSVFIFSYFQVTFYPQGLSLLLFPLIFYAFFKSEKQNIQYTIIFLIFIFLVPFTHVYIAAVIIFCLSSIVLLKFYLEKSRGIHLKSSLNILLLSIVLFFVWWSSFSVFKVGITQLNNWIISESVNIPRTAELNPIFNMGLNSYLQLFFKMYGADIILLSLSIVSIFLIFWAFKMKDKKNQYEGFLMITLVFLVSCLSYFLLFLVQGKTTIGRLLGSNIGFWALPLLSGLALVKLLNIKKIGFILVVGLLITSFSLSALSVYRSPWILQPNWQITYSDASVVDWYDQHKLLKENTMSFPIGRVSNVPVHFGYNNNSRFGSNFYGDYILIIGEYRQKLINDNKILTNSPLLEVWGHNNITDDDLMRLNTDNSVNFLYSNGEDKIILVRRVI